MTINLKLNICWPFFYWYWRINSQFSLSKNKHWEYLDTCVKHKKHLYTKNIDGVANTILLVGNINFLRPFREQILDYQELLTRLFDTN